MAHAPNLPTFLGLTDADLKRFGESIEQDTLIKRFEAAEVPEAPDTYQRSSGIRNMFGLPKPEDLYVGMRPRDLELDGHSEDQRRQATVELMEKIVELMRRSDIPVTGNEGLPAGYTYLLQFMAHDIVQNLAPPPNADDFSGYFVRDYRSRRLELDTLYGGGPIQSAIPYATRNKPSSQRYFFRLSKVPPSESGSEDKLDLDVQPARDIGRVSCPYLSDQLQESYRGSRADALIADSRNDDNLFIAQITALFQTFHNLVLNSILNDPSVYGGAHGGTLDDFLGYRAFLRARLIVGYVYRQIILKDVLFRLLDPVVYESYRNKFDAEAPLNMDQHADLERNVPSEFSHAAFRFGHFIIRKEYNLNKDRKLQPLGEFLDRTSGGKLVEKLPIACDWLVDWSQFFFSGDEYTKNPDCLNPSNLIVPSLENGVLYEGLRFPNQDDENKPHGREGGLFYRDLIRGAEGQIRTVSSLLDEINADLKENSPQLRKEEVAKQMKVWLRTVDGIDLTEGQRQSIIEEPPLLLYVLVEAWNCNGGEKLGPLGSIVLSEVIFGSLDIARNRTLNERTIRDIQDTGSNLSRAVFPDRMPVTMRQLVDYVARGIGSEWHCCN